MVILDHNNKITPAAKIPLGTNTDGLNFDEILEYASVLIILIYISSKYSPDIHFTVKNYARLTHNPRKSHDGSVKSICRYLVETQGQGLNFDPNSAIKLAYYANADF